MGKARSSTDVSDDLRDIRNKNSYLNGIIRNNSNRSTNNVSTYTPVSNISDNFSNRGGIVATSISYAKTTTATLASSGIIDLMIYNTVRLVITNSPQNTLKVLNPVMGDGQFIYIRAVTGQAVPIQNTNATGNLTTGNIELMGGANYTLTGDDWIGFCYDSIDLKWHQFTAGKLNIGGGGGGGGEVFTWTNSHSAAGFSLIGADDISFTAGSTFPSVGAGINSNSDGLEFTVSSITRWFEWFQNSTLTMLHDDPDLAIYTANPNGATLSLHNTSVADNTHKAGTINFLANETGGIERTWGQMLVSTSSASATLKYSDMFFSLYHNNSFIDFIIFSSLNELTLSRFGFRAMTSTEISYQVDNAVLVVGSRGSVQIPTDSNTGATITDDFVLDSLFGNIQGASGVTGLRGTGTPIFWVRRVSGSMPLWRGTSLTISST